MTPSTFSNYAMCLCPVGELAANETRRMNGGKMPHIVDGERFASNRSRAGAKTTTGDNYDTRRRRLSGSFVFADTGDMVRLRCVGLLPGENIQKNQPHSEKMTPLRDCHSA